jgi:transposase
MASIPELRVGIDVGCHQHRVGISDASGGLLEEFDVSHTPEGFRDFFRRVTVQKERLGLPVVVAMEGFNGHARPLDSYIRLRGYRLYSVNNLKLARFKEIFPGAAKSDPIDTRKILELFHLREHLPLAKGVLHEVAPIPPENEKLKRLSRRRRQLIDEKVRVVNRLQADLQAVCPGLVEFTGQVDNLWFLRFLTCRESLIQLRSLRRRTLLQLPGVGEHYARQIQAWQKRAEFAPDVDYVGPMIIADGKRILELLDQVKALEGTLAHITRTSELAGRLSTIVGFGVPTAAALAGEIGTIERFASQSSLALYLGVAPLDNQSGQYQGVKAPRQVNKRAKSALKMALMRHITFVPESKAYYEKKRKEGKSHHQALRAVGRHLVRVIWSMLKNKRDYEMRNPSPTD